MYYGPNLFYREKSGEVFFRLPALRSASHVPIPRARHPANGASQGPARQGPRFSPGAAGVAGELLARAAQHRPRRRLPVPDIGPLHAPPLGPAWPSLLIVAQNMKRIWRPSPLASGPAAWSRWCVPPPSKRNTSSPPFFRRKDPGPPESFLRPPPADIAPQALI